MTESRPESDYEDSLDIAVIGMAARFPGAPELDRFWRNLLDGRESLTHFTDDELRERGVDEALLGGGNYVKAGNVLADIESFDAALFGISPREAELMDPQHRILLETAYAALGRAGCDPDRYDGPIGVYTAASTSSYLMFNLAAHRELIASVGLNQVILGNTGDFAAARISYELGLEGPSVNLQTACSSSLVAIVTACQALQSFQCDVALAGGVSVDVRQAHGYEYRPDGLFSPDGHTRSYDADAKGTVGGNGAGVVVLKRLADAVHDGDHIQAVVKGFAVNNDGARRAGFTAPSADSQAVVIATALANADVAPQSVGYVEGHGTATILGDPIEVAALNAAYADAREPASIALGSVKPNIGHLDAAAGVAGFIKAVLTVEHGLIPPTLHHRRANPKMDLAGGPFHINTETLPWRPAGPRRAGVSSFGLGGTNAHVILEQSPPLAEPAPAGSASGGDALLMLSAAGPEALDAATQELADHLRTHPDLDLGAVAHTLARGRQQLPHRRVLVARSIDEARDALEARTDGRLLSGQADRGADRTVAFMFTGFGDQYPGMARELYAREPAFRVAFDRCADICRDLLDEDLRTVVLSDPGPVAPGQGMSFRDMVRPAARPEHRLDHPRHGYPATFAVEYALAELWRSWGVTPAAMIGHSLGETVAACVAGVFDLPDALRLTVARARLIEEQPDGAMVAVPMSPEDARRYTGPAVTIAAVNGPGLCVLAGPAAEVAEVEQRLTDDGVTFRRLAGRSGFHSPLMDPVVERYRAELGTVALRPPAVPLISNTTGTWLTDEQATDPDYWARHLREPVLFGDGLETLLATGHLVLLEVGPGRTLSTAALQHPAGQRHAGRAVLASLPSRYDAADDRSQALRTLGQLWLAGVAVDAGRPGARRVPLPTYPFQRRPYWIDPNPDAEPAPTASRRGSVDGWLWAPTWRRLPPVAAPKEVAGSRWLVLGDAGGRSERLVARLRAGGAQVITVTRGPARDDPDPDTVVLDPADPAALRGLIAELRAAGRLPANVAHFWSLDPLPAADRQRVAAALHAGLASLVALVQAGGDDLITGDRRWYVVTHGGFSVSGQERVVPENAMLAGVCRVVPQELPNIHTVLIDAESADPDPEAVADVVLADAAGGADHSVLALRGRHRWTPSYDRIPAAPDEPAPLRDGGVYLITGGLGRIGLTLARHLAARVRARLVLVGRTALPDRARWDEIDAPEVALRIAAVRELERLGAEVVLLAADVSEEAGAEAAVQRAISEFGRLDGVLHAAGSTGEKAHRMLADLGPAEIGWHVDPKVHAVHALDRALAGHRLDFAILCSSVAAILGGIGFGAYASANAFLDARAQQGPRWTSVNWEAWQFADDPLTLHGAGAAIKSLALAPEEGAAVFARILATRHHPQIIVSTADINARVAQWSRPLVAPTAGARRHARPNLANPFVAPATPSERAVAEIWGDLLGVDAVGVHDNFFEMGGSSLLGLQVVHRIRQEMDMPIPLTVVYEGPTVHTLAKILDGYREGTR